MVFFGVQNFGHCYKICTKIPQARKIFSVPKKANRWSYDRYILYGRFRKVYGRTLLVYDPLMPGGHYMYRIVVTICTTSLTSKNSTFCPHSVFMCFVWIWEQTAIISLYSINWLVFVTDTKCVYCAVRTEYLN